MNTERWHRVEALFVQALELPEAERASFVDEACADDVEVRRELEALLASMPAGGAWLRNEIAAEVQLLASDAAEAKLGGRIGPFRLIKLLGQGGMGAVYLAERDDALFSHRVAIKMLSYAVSSPEATARLRDERQILAALEHPNIVRLLDGGSTDDGLPYLVMEHIDGASVTVYAQQHQLSVRARVELIRQVCAALQYAHQKLVVHRDIKPSNILVDAGGIPKILDFGIAKLLAPVASFERQARTRTGFSLFTPEYASPEQARGDAVSTVTDVYSVGAVLYELVTGEPPHRTTDSAVESLRVICEVDPPRPSAVGSSAPRRRELAGDLDNIILKALHKEPARRYASMEQLADDLGRWLDGMPVAARPSTITYHARKFVRRNKVLVIAATLVVGIQVRAMWVTRSARELAEARLTAGYVEQGRQALLDNKHLEAAAYLTAAWRRDDRSTAVAFMLARAVDALRPERLRLAGHDGTVWWAEFSPGGKQIITADDRRARLWNAGTGELLFTLPHDDMVASAVFNADGRRAATASYDGSVRVWDAATGHRDMSLTGRAEDGRIHYRKAVFGRDDLIAAVHWDGSLADVWDARSGVRVTTIENPGARGPDVDIAVSPDGRWLAMAGQGPHVQIWDTTSWTRVARLPADDVPSIAFDPARPRIATVSRSGVAAIWDVAEGRRLMTLQDAGEPMDHVAYSPDGAWIANASRDGVVRVWDASSGSLAAMLRDHHGKILWVEFDPTSTWIASAGVDGVVTVSDRATGARVATFERAHREVKMVRFAPDAGELVAASVDGIAHVWPMYDSYRRFGAPPRGKGCGTDVVPREDGRFLAVSCETGAQIWDTASDKLLAELPGPQPLPQIPDPYPAVTALGDRAAVALGNTVAVFALPGGARVRTIEHPALVRTLAFAPAGHDLVTASADGTLLVIRDDREPMALPSPTGAITAVAFTSDGHAIAASAGDHRIRIYDLERGNAAYELDGSPQIADVRALRISPDGRRLIAMVMDKNTAVPVLWDLPGRRRLATLSRGKDIVLAARFVDDHRIVTASRDGAARLWDAATGELQRAFLGSSVVAFDAAVNPDGTILAMAAGDGAVRFWDIASGRLIWLLHAHRSFVNGVHFAGADVISRGYDGDIARWSLPLTPPANLAELVSCLPLQLDEKTGALVDGKPCDSIY